MGRSDPVLPKDECRGRGVPQEPTKKRAVAEELPLALRAYHEGKHQASCQNEPDFVELHEALGDRRGQERIRRENLGRHCPLLEDNPSACDGCKFNPYQDKERGPLLIVAEKYARSIAELADRVSQVEVGWLGPEQLSPEEAAAVLAYRSTMRALEREAQAKMIGLQIAQFLVKAQ